MNELKEQMFSAFSNLIVESNCPLLITFQNQTDRRSSSPITEIIQQEFKGKLRSFELDYSHSQKIREHYQLPKTETAVIFEKGQTDKRLHGFRNVRKYLRTIMQTN